MILGGVRVLMVVLPSRNQSPEDVVAYNRIVRELNRSKEVPLYKVRECGAGEQICTRSQLPPASSPFAAAVNSIGRPWM